MSIDIHAKVLRGGHARPFQLGRLAAVVHRTDVLELATTQPLKAFLAVYDDIHAALLADSQSNLGLDNDRLPYVKEMMDTNCKGGKYNRGLSVVEIALEIARALRPTGSPAELSRLVHDASVCGWAIEFMQAHFLVLDDIMDGSEMRRGNPCWYRFPGVTTPVAINDGLILMAWVTRMLEIFLSDRENHAQLFRMLHDVHMKTCMGQFYDTTSMIDSTLLRPRIPQVVTTSYRDYTVKNYGLIARFKTSYYTYHLSFLFGLAIGGATGMVSATDVEQLALTVGEYFQIQDDFLDCFGTPEQIGKIGTDIEDRKCCWLAATFQEIASAEQKAVFAANYGYHDSVKVARIKALYEEVHLKQRFAEYEAAAVEATEVLLGAISRQCPSFEAGARKLWNRTYKRSK